MSEDSPAYAISDEQGLIRYNWPEIQLLFTAGVSAADIAKSLTKDCPEAYDTARNSIAMRSRRYEWSKVAEDARKLVSGQSEAISAVSRVNSALSPTVLGLGANIALERKSNYINGMSEFGDKTIKLLRERKLDTLEDAAMAGKLMEPVHGMMKDIHGLNAREPVASLNVNILSEGGMPRFDMSDEPKQE